MSLPAPVPALVDDLRASLEARLERLLTRPVIARVGGIADDEPDWEVEDLPEVFQILDGTCRSSRPDPEARHRANPWQQDPSDGTWKVEVSFDYDDLWRGAEKQVLEAVAGTVEGFVAYLTDAQATLLERSPREFLALNPRPEAAELVTFHKEMYGGVERVTAVVLAEPPRSPHAIRHIAIVPNLIPLERQLAALTLLEEAESDGPLGPLRVLLGLDPADLLARVAPHLHAERRASPERLDQFQADCVRKALSSPHFSVLMGPPGSGKTTVITTIIRQALERGHRVLVVSPTHVAVDNVVEKLLPAVDAPDDLELRSLPLRYAARSRKLLPRAATCWVGPKNQRRAGAIAKRLERRLCETLPLAKDLFGRVDDGITGQAPLTAAVADLQGVLCGTPIGLLSYDPVKDAAPGTFDLLVVDEVSKMTLPEFLAVAVKARRWVLVGDPEQLPPYNDTEENATTLDDLLPPALELTCSIGAALERCHPEQRREVRLLVVARDPDAVARATRTHLDAVGLRGGPPIQTLDEARSPGIVITRPQDLSRALETVSPVHGRDRTFHPHQAGSTALLVERGVSVPRPAFASGQRFVEARTRAQAMIFETSFAAYHAQPWALRARQRLTVIRFRNGLDKYLPSAAAIASLTGWEDPARAVRAREGLLQAMARRYALNTVSVYDWLTGIPVEHFDTAPLTHLHTVTAPLAPLREAVHPYVGVLRRQYRMHPSLSQVPRELFYFGEALEDGVPGPAGPPRVRFLQVEVRGPGGESNDQEARKIVDALAQLASGDRGRDGEASILVVTPYRAQERCLQEAVGQARTTGRIGTLDVEVCTLDRCQGREADYVFISLVRNRSTSFLDAPKRWNVALTRAKKGLFLVGDVQAYLQEADRARQDLRSRPDEDRPYMSLLARILEAYDRQINPRMRTREVA